MSWKRERLSSPLFGILYTMKAANDVKLICILIVNHIIKQRIVQTNYKTF